MQAYVSAAAKISRLAVGDPTISAGITTYRRPAWAVAGRRTARGCRSARAAACSCSTCFRSTPSTSSGSAAPAAGCSGCRPVGGDEALEITLNGERVRLHRTDAPRGTLRLKIPAGPADDRRRRRPPAPTRAASTICSPSWRTTAGVQSLAINGPLNPTGPGDTPSRRRIFACRPATAARGGALRAADPGRRSRARALRRPVARERPDARHADGLLRVRAARCAASRPASSTRWRACSSIRSSSSGSSASPPACAPAPSTGSAISSWRRGCRSSSGAASRTRSCWRLAGRRPAPRARGARAAGAAHAGRSPGARAGRQLRRPVAAPARARRRRAGDEGLRRQPALRRSGARRSCCSRRSSARTAASSICSTPTTRSWTSGWRGTTASRTSAAAASGASRSDDDAAARAARPRQHADRHVGRQPHVAGEARQVDPREPARRAGAAAAARRRDQSRGNRPRAGAAPTSLRQRLEQHRANPSCASCHAVMDPIGFSLENFDLIGKWREVDGGVPIDAAGTARRTARRSTARRACGRRCSTAARRSSRRRPRSC